MKKISLLVLGAVFLFSSFAFSQSSGSTDSTIITFVHVSDNHYGLFKNNFQGATNVSAKNVNAALVSKINTLPTTTLPSDDGVNAGKTIGSIDFLFDTGDISNRQESANNIQSSSASWGQFSADYLNSLTTKDSKGNNTKVYITPGNHDITNAIGYYKTMVPATDPTSLFSIFNLYMNPATPRTALTYNYQTDKVHYSFDYKGVHFACINFWPDSSERIWLDNDLKNVSPTTPVLIFTHVPPDCESRFFINPNGSHDINSKDQFENQLPESFKDGLTITSPDTIEVRGLCNWLKNHRNVVGYFNGHTNYTEFYTFKGLDNDLSLNVYRVDSPMKGAASASDETKLAFNLIQIDTKTMTITARECLWDTNPSNTNAPIVFGAKKTSSLIPQTPTPPVMQFIFTSDSHYGLTKSTFRGNSNVPAQTVNAALVNQINNLPSATLPLDNGVKAGMTVGSIDFVVNGGDIANRQETGIQSDSVSWSQFVNDYVNGITLKNSANQKTQLFVIPGNHDITNAIGYYKSMTPAIDMSSYLGIYNMMLNPTPLKTKDNFNYASDKVTYSKNLGGVHFIFIGSWPDSVNRIWITEDLKKVNPSTPVVLFSHDEPPSESKHFTNPNGTHNINSTDKFENVHSEMFKDGKLITDANTIEQRGLANFILNHPNIKVYFHGNDHIEQFNTWTGPDNNINPPLQVFGVDSPMKGSVSASDETKLCYQFVVLDSVTKQMTVRECFWNTNPSQQGGALVWGASKTINLNEVGVTVSSNHYYTDMICINEDIVFTPTFTKSGNYNYTWMVNNVISGTGSTLKYKFSTPGQYVISLGITGTNNETGLGSLTITITDQCPITIINNDFSTCKNSNPTITPTIFGGKGFYSYNWLPNSDFVDYSVKNGTVKNPLYSKSYDLVVTDVATNIKGVNHVNMTVLQSSSVSFNKTYLYVKNSDPVDLTNEDIIKINIEGGKAPYQYKWLNDNGIQIDPTNIYPPLGSSKYYLTVTDANGCNSIEKRLIVFHSNGKEVSEDIVPGITGLGYMFMYPNPVNDNVSIYVDFNSQLPAELKIYNILGKSVFEMSIGNTKTFEQQINVSSLPTGVYTLVIQTTENTYTKQFVKQ